jgi:hypothetical protein
MNRKSLETQKREVLKAATVLPNLGLLPLGLRPADFPLGSAQSRAAARSQLQRFEANRACFVISHSVPRPRLDPSIAHEGEWCELDDGRLMRWDYAPNEIQEPHGHA